ncbi:replication protein A 70 kDa DNA-binding subunit B isoform X2 [Rosa chinensis]|nr:replication protein A 70 kDa DNA-binding subunit B isoform X2 [Rosa chinensis]XP_040370043.1 replication protein A 70 kDa DNA-binding subunit B isoform X2 [Rosa chinensis]
MANQEDVRPTLLRNITAFSLAFNIRVRVSRIWRPRRFNSDIYDGLHYLLIDETGDTIHALIDESDYPYVSDKMQQGQIYDISVFHTRKDPAKPKVANHDVQLYFNESTKFVPVEGIVPLIPEYSFHLLDFSELPTQSDHQTLLIDLYGCIKSATPEYQVPIKDTGKMESKIDLIVENVRREDLKITLWGDTARKFNLESIEASGSAILALITSLRVTKFRQQIQASTTNHSCILITPQIQQTSEYEAEFSKPGDRVKTVPAPAKQLTPEQMKKKTTMTVSQLNALDPELYTDVVYCTASIRRFPMHNGWWYKSCAICHKLLKKKRGCHWIELS